MYTPLQVHRHPYHGGHLNKYFVQYLTFATALMRYCRGCRRIQSGSVVVCYSITLEFVADCVSRYTHPSWTALGPIASISCRGRSQSPSERKMTTGGLKPGSEMCIFQNQSMLPLCAPILLHQVLCLANGACKVSAVAKRDIHDVIKQLVRRHIEVIV